MNRCTWAFNDAWEECEHCNGLRKFCKNREVDLNIDG
jgi:hypothetical protein